jgi:hypothetical protein
MTHLAIVFIGLPTFPSSLVHKPTCCVDFDHLGPAFLIEESTLIANEAWVEYEVNRSSEDRSHALQLQVSIFHGT